MAKSKKYELKRAVVSARHNKNENMTFFEVLLKEGYPRIGTLHKDGKHLSKKAAKKAYKKLFTYKRYEINDAIIFSQYIKEEKSTIFEVCPKKLGFDKMVLVALPDKKLSQEDAKEAYTLAFDKNKKQLKVEVVSKMLGIHVDTKVKMLSFENKRPTTSNIYGKPVVIFKSHGTNKVMDFFKILRRYQQYVETDISQTLNKK